MSEEEWMIEPAKWMIAKTREGLSIVCVQGFDLRDYTFFTEQQWDTEEEAKEILKLINSAYIDGFKDAHEVASSTVLRVASEVDAAIELGISAATRSIKQSLDKMEN